MPSPPLIARFSPQQSKAHFQKPRVSSRYAFILKYPFARTGKRILIIQRSLAGERFLTKPAAKRGGLESICCRSAASAFETMDPPILNPMKDPSFQQRPEANIFQSRSPLATSSLCQTAAPSQERPPRNPVLYLNRLRYAPG